MKNKFIETNNDMLRSDKVRKLLGEMPQSLSRLGMAIIAAVMLSLVAAVLLLPYPYSEGETIFQHILR